MIFPSWQGVRQSGFQGSVVSQAVVPQVSGRFDSKFLFVVIVCGLAAQLV
jgi:hypothetical protein